MNLSSGGKNRLVSSVRDSTGWWKRVLAIAGLALFLVLVVFAVGDGETADTFDKFGTNGGPKFENQYKEIPSGGTVAYGMHHGRRVTMVILNRMSLEDILGRPESYLRELATRGAVGLMNTRTGGGLTAENAFTTLGGGLRLLGSGAAKVALPAGTEYGGELVGDIYRRRTGEELAPEALVVLDIESIKANNVASLGIDRVGVIGEALRQKGGIATAIGNSDYDREYQRWGALVAMDARGQVPVAYMDANLRQFDPAFPTGYRTDPEALAMAYGMARSQAQFLVVDLGDMDRVEVERKQLAPSLYQEYRQLAMDSADVFLRQIMETMDLAKEWLLVVSPLPATSGIAQGKLLTPIVAWGPDIAPGLLVSSTTRRPGVVANYDITYTVLDWLELDHPQGLPGATLVSVGGVAEQDRYLQDLLRRSASTYQQRPPLLRAFVSLEIVIYLVVFALVIIFSSLPRGWIEFFSFALLFVAAIPLALLVLPVLRPATVVTAFLFTLGLASLITGLAQYRISGIEHRYGIVCGLTALALVLDALLGGPLIKLSPLGYDVMLGARFYGIGNEFMGILIGSSLVAVLVASHRWPKASVLPFLWLPIVTFVLAAPGLGANAGGTVTALIAFPLAWILTHKVRILRVIIVGGLVLAVTLGLNLYPIAGVGSHVGRAIKALFQGNWPVILQIIERKLAMNWRLMRYSIWSKGLLVALGVMALLVYRPTSVVEAVIEKHAVVRDLVFCTIVASIIALIFNDSGVVAGGTTSVYAAGLILNLTLEQRRECIG